MVTKKCYLLAAIVGLVSVLFYAFVTSDWLYYHTQCQVVGHKSSVITAKYSHETTTRHLPDKTAYQCGETLTWRAL